MNNLPVLAVCLLSWFSFVGGGEVFTDPSKASPDYLIQGEYAGDGWGVQVIALGDATFRAVLHRGGLPGDGWNGSARIQIDGKRAANGVTFTGANATFRIPDVRTDSNPELSGLTDKGEHFTLKKIHRTSPTAGAKPPENALILFDGRDAEQWLGARIEGEKVLPMGTKTKRNFTNFTMHLEFILPFMPAARGQKRGNSGVYLQDRYEIQVLDSFGLKGEANECGAIYTKTKPAVNMCYPPLTWQTYDVEFESAKFDSSGRKLKNAVTTVKHNGVLIHDHVQIDGPTGRGRPESPAGGPIFLQDHGNPVFFRNIWVLERTLSR
jgi:Domain of Unknown Function (DUF1080)